MTLDDLECNGRKALLRKKSFYYGAHQKNVNEDRLILSVANRRSLILVSGNKRFVQIERGHRRKTEMVGHFLRNFQL